MKDLQICIDGNELFIHTEPVNVVFIVETWYNECDVDFVDFFKMMHDRNSKVILK